MKKYLIVYYGDAPECVEGFHKDCERSCKGALHVAPGRKLTVTQDELEYMKSKYGHMMPKLRVLSEKVAASKPEPKKGEPKKEAPAAKAQEEAQKEEKAKAKSSKKSSRKKAGR